MVNATVDVGATKTRILYRAYLSFYQLNNDYLPILLNNDILEFDEHRRRYFTTNKGRQFLRNTRKLNFKARYLNRNACDELSKVRKISATRIVF